MLFVIALVTLSMALWVMGSVWFMSPGGKPAPFILPAKLGYWAMVIKPYVCTAFCMAMAAMAYLSRKESRGIRPSSETDVGEVLRSSPAASPGASRAVFGKR